MIGAIFTVDKANGFGFENKLPWHIPEDFAHFKRMTFGSKIVMGRNTFESLPGILPGREHIVLSSTLKPGPAHKVYSSISDLVEFEGTNFWVIGGPGVIQAVHSELEIDIIFKSMIYKKYETDIKFDSSAIIDEMCPQGIVTYDEFAVFKYVNRTKF